MIDFRTNRRARIAFPLSTLLVVLAATGCNDSSTDDTEGIVCLYPDHGAAAVPEQAILMVEVPSQLTHDVEITAFLEADDGTQEELGCHPGEVDGLIPCLRAGLLERDTAYTFAAEIVGLPETYTENTFTTAPPSGVSYEIGSTVAIERLGGSPIAASVLDSLLGDGSPLLLVGGGIHGVEELPSLGTHWVWGPGAILVAHPGTYAVVEDVGYPFTVLTQIGDDGWFSGRSDHAYLPIRLDGVWHQVRLDDVLLHGEIDPDATGLPLREIQIEALLPRDSIDRIADQIGTGEAFLLQTLVEYNVDSDQDGTVDSARLLLRGTGAPAEIHVP